MRYRNQFSPWRPSKCVLTLRSKAMNPDMYDTHIDKGRFYGLYAWNYKASKARHPSLNNIELQNKLYTATLAANNWLILQVLNKGADDGKVGD